MKRRCDRCGIELKTGQRDLLKSAEPQENRGTVGADGRKRAYRLCPRCRGKEE